MQKLSYIVQNISGDSEEENSLISIAMVWVKSENYEEADQIARKKIEEADFDILVDSENLLEEFENILYSDEDEKDDDMEEIEADFIATANDEGFAMAVMEISIEEDEQEDG